MAVELNGPNTFYGDLIISMLAVHRTLYPTESSFTLDVGCIRNRLEHEGLPFVTRSLPLLAKALEDGIETGQYKVPAGFRRSKRNPGLPAFLQDVLLVLFDMDGMLRPDVTWIDVVSESANAGSQAAQERVDACIDAIRCIRQIGYFVYKLKLPYDTALESAYADNFVRIDEEIGQVDLDAHPELLDIVSYEIGRVLEGVDLGDIIPRHGPGAVATGETGDEKWVFTRTYDGLSDSYDLSYFTVGGAAEIADRKDWHDSLDHLPGGASRVIFVLKNSGGPRVIAAEPPEYQWIQQGQRMVLCPVIEKRTSFRINFRDQAINGRLALSSSKTRRDATLDMKDASDRVLRLLVKRTFPEAVFTYLDASRSAAAVLPDGRVIVLNKFASMGSAVCFPVEALLFWAIAVAAISLLKPGDRQRARLSVYTYGDDLIVPREYAAVVMEALEACGLRVNRTKSFVHGFFRESCGVDAFNGADVTPVRMRAPCSYAWSPGPDIISHTKLANALEARGYREAAEIIYGVIERSVRLPFGTINSAYPCRLSSSEPAACVDNRRARTRMKWDSGVQRFKIFTHVVKTRVEKTNLDGWTRLLRNLTMGPGETPDLISKRGQTVLRRRWTYVT